MIQYVDITEYKYLLWRDVIVYTEIFPPEDIHTEAISLDKSGMLTLRGRIFMWDGPSGPTLDAKDSMLGSAVHDALYRLMRLNLLDIACREQADRLLMQLCEASGMSDLRADIWYVMVQDFASGCAEPNGEPEFEILEA